MAESALARKLLIKPGMTLRLLAPPSGYVERLEPLPNGARIAVDGPADLVQFFAGSRSELDTLFSGALQALKPGGIFWASFPKGSSKVQTDLTRDRGWDAVHEAGWQLVSLISVDDTWSAGRLRPIEATKRRSRQD